MLHKCFLKFNYTISTLQVMTAPAALNVAATEQYLSMDKAHAFSAFSLDMVPFNLNITFTVSHNAGSLPTNLDILDPNKELIKYRLYRHHCIKRAIINEEDQDENNSNPSEYAYVKDLRIITL